MHSQMVSRAGRDAAGQRHSRDGEAALGGGGEGAGWAAAAAAGQRQ